jgi:hypothetical protein
MGFDGSMTTLPSSRSAIWGISALDWSNQIASTTTSASAIASRTGAAVARSPSSLARASACDWSRAASTTRSPPRTRSRASPLPIWPTPIIAVVISFLPIHSLAEVDLAVMRDRGMLSCLSSGPGLDVLLGWRLEEVVDLAGHIALEAADDLGLGVAWAMRRAT